MTSPYVSPIPVVKVMMTGRIHLYPQADGSTVQCQPAFCRECWRERNWNSAGELVHGPL